jgi:hypothetical protein
MSWKKYFSQSPGPKSAGNPGIAHRNYGSYLPEVYSGHPNRIERYYQYESMDSDSEVNSALDILTEFCTQNDNQNNLPFTINYKEKATDVEIKILESTLQKWCKMNQFKKRAFRLFRNTLKYGDQFFVRDPETFEWYWVDPTKVDKIIVNEADAKEPESYVIRDLNLNKPSLQATQQNSSGPYNAPGTGPYSGSAYTNIRGGQFTGPSNLGGRFDRSANQYAVKAEHVIHLSLSEGLDANWPFGNSILEYIYKVYKQKELLEDAVIIYRVQRAPERRVFYIDVGNMPTNLAMAFVERVKNEIWQRRLPSLSGGGTSVIDAGYNPLCLDLDTKIPLLDGRTLTLSQLIAEFDQGKENWTYSCNPETGAVVPGLINWAGLTRKNAEVLKITFDNGKELICTPDHKIPVFGKGFVEAKDLTETDSLISFNTKLDKISKNSNEYEKVWDHESKSWKFTHRLVANFFKDRAKHQEFTYLTEYKSEAKQTIHHKDHNRFNNDPRNLTFMNKNDHILYHSAQKKDFWKNMSDEYRTEISSKISNTLVEHWENMSEQERITALWNIRAAQKKSVFLRQNDSEVAASYKKNAGKARRQYIENNSEFKAKLIKNLDKRVKIKNQKINFTFEMLQLVVEKVRNSNINKNDVIKLCNSDNKLLELLKINNSEPLDYKNAQCKIDFNTFGYSKLNRLLKAYNYKNWKTFVKEVNNFNHRIVKIESIPNRDVGTITIDGTERWHDYHTFAIDSGIFVKNSINEDYFFPQTAEGRGSKVETLPGGQNLGEIDDLKFFTNKLFRALRIPSSYMPTGPDDSGNTVNDGKVGTALIQELRFNKYCERLQNLISPVMDREFKLYLKFLGINIDSSVFDLEFNEPMNFAKYRQLELDTAQSSVYANISQIPQISKRFGLKRFLGLTEDEIRQNEEMWMEENDPDKLDQSNVVGADLRNVGVTGGSIESDMETEAPPTAPPEEIGMPTAELGAPIPTAVPTGGAGGGMGGPAGGMGV